MLFFVICAAFALFPEKVLFGAQSGLALCINAVIPSLLPFMVISGSVIGSGFSKPLGAAFSKILSPVTGMSSNGCVCFVTGVLGGYGAGARAVCHSYRENLISKEEAERLLSFCNNAGPLFIIGTVGVGFYGSKTIGVVLFMTQLMTAIICARVFSGGYHKKTKIREEWRAYKKNKPPIGELVTKSAIESGDAIVTACVFVILFSAILEVIPFGEYRFIGGFLEVTRGCSEASARGGDSLALTSAFLAWGGMSVHFQADALCDSLFSMKRYYIGKISASVIAYVIAKTVCGDLYLFLFLTVVMTGICLICTAIRHLLFRARPLQSLFRQQRHS